jgi:hypothetical protein
MFGTIPGNLMNILTKAHELTNWLRCSIRKIPGSHGTRNSARTTRKKEEIKDFRFFLLNEEVFYVKVESVLRKRLR